ncbi:di-trans,poly-cis-decaprenylcistransferase [archaeon]|nr:di-trans,poly-cis-decaprenylcistransferase [archaeon]MBL7057459.1 di-trans,poly-cis-decaprenylcistransferase [Candidatus Woesearchaeota archaeon]
MKPVDSAVPKHIGIILDGNRRFAKKLMLKPWKGHEWGAVKVENMIDWAIELGIKELTLYALSMQNLDRPKKEFGFLMALFKKEFLKLEQDPRVYSEHVRVNIIGRIHLLPADLREVLDRIMDKTKDHDGFILNFAIAYGGREEIIDAIMKLNIDIKDGKVDARKVNEEIFQNYLYTPGEPDLIIRTGGAHRTSNFLIWQSNYSEYLFFEKTWPEFEKEDFVQAIDNYVQRERRFGR